MATAANGVTVPAGSDVYNPASDMGALNSSLRGRLHLLAANATARTTLAGTCGWTPTASDPLVVLQTDTQVLWVYNGTVWAPLVDIVAHARFPATALQAIGAGAFTAVRINSTVDSSASPPYALASFQVTVSQSAVYMLAATVSATLPGFSIRILVGTTVVTQSFVGAGASLTTSVSAPVRITAGSVVKVEIYAPSALSVTADAAAAPTGLTITQMGY